MKSASRIEHHLRHLPVATDPAADRANLARLLAEQRTAGAARRAPPPSPLAGGRRWSLAGLSTMAVLVVLAGLLVERAAPRAWAIEESIAAMQAHRAVHIVAATPGGIISLWIRANPAATQSADVLVHAPGGVVMWTRSGRTYQHDPARNEVYVEPAVTVGFVPWLSPALVGTLARVPGAEVVHGRESLFGRRTVTLLGGLVDVTGMQSWALTFDAESKLPVRLRSWRNLDRAGPPAFDTRAITFLDDLPPGLFEIEPPADARVIERPLRIPDETVGLLADPQDGIATDGLDPQAAAERILDELGRTIVAGDTTRFRQLVPLARGWNDELLRALILAPADAHARIVGAVAAGRIEQSGHTVVGPIVAVPWITLRADGAKVRDRMVIQFRSRGAHSSCVVFGPHGLPVDVD